MKRLETMSILRLLRQPNSSIAPKLHRTLRDSAPEQTDGRKQVIGTFGGCASD